MDDGRWTMEDSIHRLSSIVHRPITRILGPPALFLLLSAIFLWQPILSGQVFLPTDVGYSVDPLWGDQAAHYGARTAQNYLLSDVAYYYYPYADYAISRLSSGHFPLWNPYILTGSPFFAAAQAAILDPINLLTYPTGPYAYWTWAALIRLTLLGLTTYAFMRSIGRSVAGGLASGVVFMICGFVVAWLNYSVVTTLVWLPALFWTSTRLMQTGRMAWGAATAFTVGGLLVGGHPETQFLVGLVWASYCLYSVAVIRPQGPGMRAAARRVFFLGAMALLGVGLSAVQLLPFVDFLVNSNSIAERTGNLTPFYLGRSALFLAVSFFPNFTGNPTQKDYWARSFTNFNEQVDYIGLLAIALATLGAVYWSRRDRLAPFFAALGIIALLFDIRAPMFNLIRALPIFNVGQGVRWALVWSFCGALLAGYGLDALLNLRTNMKQLRNTGFWFLGGAVVAFGALLVIYVGIRDFSWDQSWRPLISHVKMARLFHPASVTLYWPIIFLAAGAVVVLARWKGLLKAPAMAALLVTLLYADLWTFGSSYNPVTPRQAIYPTTKTTSFLKEHIGHERFVGTVQTFRPNTPMLFGVRDVRGYEDVVDATFAQLYAPLNKKLDTVGKDGLQLRYTDHRLLQIAGVRYLLTMRKPRVATDRRPYKWLFEENRVATYENEEALPRAYVVFSSTLAPNVLAATATLLAPEHDPTRNVVLTGGGEHLAGPQLDAKAAPVAWRKDEPEDVELETNTPAPGYLVLSDNYTPDWEATLDGRGVPLLRANVVYRAVALPPGKHVVSFVYRPRLFYVGAIISVTCTLALLMLALIPLLTRRPPARQPFSDPQH